MARPSIGAIASLRGAARREDGDLRTMVTPEGVELRLRLAQVGQRAGALVLDLLITGAGFIALMILLALALAAVKMSNADVPAVVIILAAFLLRNFYFIAFEMGPRAATPGKRRFGLRVAARSGGPLTADAVFVRNAMRELELYLPMTILLSGGDVVQGWMKALSILWCAVFVLLPLFNRDRLRVGDLLAGTWVVRNPSHRLLRDLAQSGSQERLGVAFTVQQLDAYGIKELQVLEDVLRRFDRRTVASVAERIGNKIGYARGPESDGAFLNAYYAALRQRLEARALLGRRRLDKHDKA
jgi:uncharacterized RDD family membrane protein YckC